MFDLTQRNRSNNHGPQLSRSQQFADHWRTVLLVK